MFSTSNTVSADRRVRIVGHLSIARTRPGSVMGMLVAILLLGPGLPSFAAQCTVVGTGGVADLDPPLPNPILFVSQYPIAADFSTIGSTFGNHLPGMSRVARGGDLMILYPDNALCNLTREAGFGEAGELQGTNAIAVRDPTVHWDGDRALFAMVIGGPPQRFGSEGGPWQIYEVVGLAQGTPMAITQLAHQPAGYNNIMPIYSPDGRIVFVSDRPRDGRAHLYPQLDEYESAESNSGLWALDPAIGELQLLDHSPSGDFDPIVDSFGRIVFSRWDHLQTDQQDDPVLDGPVDFASEEPGATSSAGVDVFPEPRFGTDDDIFVDHRFNHFFPWMIHPDGRELETLNHIGRHELHDFFAGAFDNGPSGDEVDANVVDFIGGGNRIENFFHPAEDPTMPGLYYGTAAPEFATHSSGMIVSLTGAPSVRADQMVLEKITHPATEGFHTEGPPPPGHTGHYRDPLPLSDGRLIASHTLETRNDEDEGSFDQATGDGTTDPRYDFRLKLLAPNGEYREPVRFLTGSSGLVRSLRHFDPNAEILYSGPLWELGAVEVRSRPLPSLPSTSLPSPEAQVFAQEGVDPAILSAELEAAGLALVISRDVTTRDQADRQQPFNLRVPGGTQTAPAPGLVWEVQYLQFFQGDLIRGYEGPHGEAGRRVLARPMHGDLPNPPSSGAEGSVTLGADGSMAAFVPAQRALSWQLTGPSNEPVVRERYWVTLRPGEMRVCSSCHGVNDTDQAGDAAPTHPPEALVDLLRFWKARNTLFADDFETGNVGSWSSSSPRG